MVKNGGGENGMIFPGGENGISQEEQGRTFDCLEFEVLSIEFYFVIFNCVFSINNCYNTSFNFIVVLDYY